MVQQLRLGLDRPITSMEVNSDQPANPLLKITLKGGHVRVVHADGGADYVGPDRQTWQAAAPAVMWLGDTLAVALSTGDPDISVYLQDQTEGSPLSKQERLNLGYNVLGVKTRNIDRRLREIRMKTGVVDLAELADWFYSHSRPTQLMGHTGAVTALTVFPTSRDEQLLASGSSDGTIRLWNVRTGLPVRMAAPGSPVTSLLSFSGGDGLLQVAAGGSDGLLTVWKTDVVGSSSITGPVSTRGFSDRVATEDLLGRGQLVSTLADALRPGEGDGPTVITVDGAWGSGKSTVLEFVKKELGTPPSEARPGRKLTVSGANRVLSRPPQRVHEPRKLIKPLVVSFNPWQHQSSEQIWAGLAKSVAEAVETAIMPDANTRERYWFERNAHRVDRRHLQRQLRKRIYSPALSVAALGLGVALLGQLVKLNLWWAWVPAVGIGLFGAAQSAWRFFFSRASAFLPGELFAVPVMSNTFPDTTLDPSIRDPYYHARSGYLYLVQHDVAELLKDAAAVGYQPVVVIDDLDRCTPRTTAQVFEAINVFLSDEFPSTRFVLGLDTAVVASHVDHAYKDLADAKVVAHADDPSPGWTFLRKLVQLPVRLPPATADNVDRLLNSQLGEVHMERQEVRRGTGTTFPNLKAAATGVTEPAPAEVIAIERNAEVREHLRRRLKEQPEQSVREEKRLLNVWQFYLRVLGSANVEQACHLVAVAEIAVRWPAYLHRLRGGWLELADAVDDDVRWGAKIAKLRYAYSDRKAAANLRELLLDCDAQSVARLADRLF
ncbi:P-loop NTPase fold protein [Lentzea sp. NPDC034063]|uniref:P-loop NTPase fold protein n=1 Tax=unclassified Lentzea TaxID=2643253 RepID=UPI0033F31AD7